MSSRAIEAAKAFIRIYADDKELRKSLAGLRPAITGAAEQFNGIASSAALAGIAAAGAGLVMTAANAERTAISFEVMLGSASAAKKMLDEIYSLGANSPFGADDFMQAGQVLLNFGASAESVLPTLSMLGDVAAGDSDKLDRLTMAFGQMSAAGRLMGQDLLQFINAGFNPLQEISRKTGESMADLKKRMEAGGVSAQEVAEAFRSATSAGGRFHGMTGRLAGSTIGVWMTLKDEIMLLAKDMGRYLLPVVNGVLQAVRQLVTWFAGWGKAIVVAGTAALAFLGIMKAITLATIAYTKAQAVALALGGPKGWAVLALSLTAAAGAYAAIDASMAGVTAEAKATHAPMDTMAKDLKAIESPAKRAADAVDKVAEATQRAAEAIKGMRAPAEQVRDEVDQFAADLALSGRHGMILEGNPLVEQFRVQKSGASAMLTELNQEIERLQGNATEAGQKLAEMAAAGVDPATLAQLETLIERRDQLMQQEEDKRFWQNKEKEMEAAAEEVRQAIETVQQSFLREQMRLQQLVADGFLDQADADEFLRRNPKFAEIMGGDYADKVAGSMRASNTAKDLRSVEGAQQLYSLFNGQMDNEKRQIQLMTEIRDEQRKARIAAEKERRAYKV